MAKERTIYGLVGEIIIKSEIAEIEWLAAEQVVRIIKNIVSTEGLLKEYLDSYERIARADVTFVTCRIVTPVKEIIPEIKEKLEQMIGMECEEFEAKTYPPPPFRNQKIDFGNRCRELFPIARVFQK